MESINILARIKPNLKNIKDLCIETEQESIIIKRNQKGVINDYSINHTYTFDRVYDQNDSNVNIYNSLGHKMLRNSIRNKKNVNFFLYGQTGSGKTHTLLGSQHEQGFLELLCLDILEINYPIIVSVIEIYNNKCMDILNKRTLVKQNENIDNRFIIKQLKTKNINNIQTLSELITTITKYRSLGQSSENDISSRSHLKIMIKINGNHINLIDLAGCEKARMTNNLVEQTNYRENAFINQSLFALKECIRALLNKKTHIPFRRSELTKMLRECFEKKSDTYIMANVPQEVYNCNTSIDVLNYISSVKKIKKIESTRPKTNHVPKKENTEIPLLNGVESPRFLSIYKNKGALDILNEEEEKIVRMILEKKSSKLLVNDYRSILKKKQNIIDCNNFAIPKPPGNPPPRRNNKTPKEKFINK